jgi:hypothetical protein
MYKIASEVNVNTNPIALWTGFFANTTINAPKINNDAGIAKSSNSINLFFL